MLEIDYSTRFSELIQSLDWDIELPIEWSDYFDQQGDAGTYASDERNNQRLKVRTHGVLCFESDLPFQRRDDRSVGVYTRDFSRQGCGFLAAFELYPEEQVRIVLPTFWAKLQVMRTRRITSKCYEIGATLLQQNEPSMRAFAPAGVLDLQTT